MEANIKVGKGANSPIQVSLVLAFVAPLFELSLAWQDTRNIDYVNITLVAQLRLTGKAKYFTTITFFFQSAEAHC